MNVCTPAQAPSVAAKVVTTTRLDVAVLMLSAFVLYSLNVDFTLFGDNGMYSDYVVLRKFNEVTLHLGYYAMLSVADKLLGGLFDTPIQESAAWLNVLAGTLCVGVAYALARELFGTRRDALLCSVIFGLSGRVFFNATSSEIYMLQTLLVLLSFYLFVREYVLLAGVCGGLALLVSPLSAFAYLFYPVYDYQRSGRIRWSVLSRLACAGILVYLPYLVVDGNELLYGLRGLLTIHGYQPFDPVATLTNFPIYQFKAFTILPLLLVPAMLAWRDKRWLFALALAVGIPHLYIIFKLTGEDHVFILNTDFFFACCLVVGWRQLENFKVGRWIAPILLAAHLGLFIVSGIIHSFNPHREYAQEMRRIARTYLVGRDAVMVTDWARGVGLTFFGRPRPTSTVLNDPLFDQTFDITGRPRPPVSKLEGRQILLLDPWSPSPLNRLLHSSEELKILQEQNSLESIAERDLHLKCTQIEQTVHRLYRCLP